MRMLHVAGAFVLGMLFAGNSTAQESQAAKTTRQKLKQKITVEFKDVRTADVFSDIKNEMDKPVNFKIDNASGVSNNSKITYKAMDKTVEEILNDLSEKIEGGWYVISNAANNRVDGWIMIRKTTKGKERGYEAGKEPKTSQLVPLPSGPAAQLEVRPQLRRAVALRRE